MSISNAFWNMNPSLIGELRANGIDPRQCVYLVLNENSTISDNPWSYQNHKRYGRVFCYPAADYGPFVDYVVLGTRTEACGVFRVTKCQRVTDDIMRAEQERRGVTPATDHPCDVSYVYFDIHLASEVVLKSSVALPSDQGSIFYFNTKHLDDIKLALREMANLVNFLARF